MHGKVPDWRAPGLRSEAQEMSDWDCFSRWSSEAKRVTRYLWIFNLIKRKARTTRFSALRRISALEFDEQSRHRPELRSRKFHATWAFNLQPDAASYCNEECSAGGWRFVQGVCYVIDWLICIYISSCVHLCLWLVGFLIIVIISNYLQKIISVI